MQRLTEIAPGVLVATAGYATTTTTVVTAAGGGNQDAGRDLGQPLHADFLADRWPGRTIAG